MKTPAIGLIETSSRSSARRASKRRMDRPDISPLKPLINECLAMLFGREGYLAPSPMTWSIDGGDAGGLDPEEMAFTPLSGQKPLVGTSGTRDFYVACVFHGAFCDRTLRHGSR